MCDAAMLEFSHALCAHRVRVCRVSLVCVQGRRLTAPIACLVQGSGADTDQFGPA
jgi:hypothetical protein